MAEQTKEPARSKPLEDTLILTREDPKVNDIQRIEVTADPRDLLNAPEDHPLILVCVFCYETCVVEVYGKGPKFGWYACKEDLR